MIYVKRHSGDSSQKVVSLFLKRVKKRKLVAHKRNTTYWTKPISDLKKKRKAIRKASFLQDLQWKQRIGKVA